jgi:hypothetical protein
MVDVPHGQLVPDPQRRVPPKRSRKDPYGVHGEPHQLDLFRQSSLLPRRVIAADGELPPCPSLE